MRPIDGLHEVAAVADEDSDCVEENGDDHDFNAIAACLGTANLAAIFAHLNRALLGAPALENAQIVRPDASPIPRLFSAGEMRSIYNYQYQGNRQ